MKITRNSFESKKLFQLTVKTNYGNKQHEVAAESMEDVLMWARKRFSYSLITVLEVTDLERAVYA